ncbi:hypothetical protein NDU88_004758 [Pleurodeles waltl]|uniref:Uncharacterized protein n=1 Tax=Pleurodeles waltl TaxID=8319 RepID=A0AAV7RGM4_PLEWA|nr:hypothetical protein NDU88_004758 [Pleurodeles waltl]
MAPGRSKKDSNIKYLLQQGAIRKNITLVLSRQTKQAEGETLDAEETSRKKDEKIKKCYIKQFSSEIKAEIGQELQNYYHKCNLRIRGIPTATEGKNTKTYLQDLLDVILERSGEKKLLTELTEQKEEA